MSSKVHKVRFYNPKPLSINCVSYNKTNKQVAIAREDSSIEIWDLSHSPYLLKFIPGVENGSVESLGWVNERLLSTGLSGALVEWDLNKLCLKTSVLLTGYAAWCLDVNSSNTLVSVGTEQGYVNLYSVTNDEIVYEKLFDKQEGRILCCKFNSKGNILVTGSVDTLRVWNVATGQVINRMSVRRRGQENIVWCLSVLSDDTIVTGESYGKLSFWDITTGDQIESFTTHKTDILAIAVSDDEKSVYCAGVDPIIVNFMKVENTKKNGQSHWVKNVQRHIHEHDVRGLAMQDNKLISVGLDGYMTFSSYPPKWVMRIPPMLPPKRTAVSAQKKLLLLRYRNHLEVWKLGSYATSQKGKCMISNLKQTPKQDKKFKNLENDSAIANLNKSNVDKVKGQALKLTENTLKLASIQAKGKKQIQCAAMSPNGEFIVYATESNIRMLKLEQDEEANTTSLSKLLISGIAAYNCDRVAFTDDSSFAIVHSTGTIYVLQVDAQVGATVVQSIDCTKYLKETTLLHLEVSKKTNSGAVYLVAADTSGAINVWSKTKKVKFEHYVSLPKYKCVPSALTIIEDKGVIIVAYVDQKIVEYDLINKKFNDWINKELPQEWYNRNTAVRSISVHPQRENAIIFQDETSLWILERNSQNENEEPKAKKRPVSHETNASLRIIPVKYLADFHWLQNDEAVMIELLPENIISQLPPVIQIKKPPYIS